MKEIENRKDSIFLSLSSVADEKLVAELLGRDYSILRKGHDISDDIIDLVVVDFAELNRLYDSILSAKKRPEHPIYLSW